MWRATAALLVAAAASTQALQRPVEEIGSEVLTQASVCARAAGTGWFPVIVPGCKEALSEDGYDTYGALLACPAQLVRLRPPPTCATLALMHCVACPQRAPGLIVSARLVCLQLSRRCARGVPTLRLLLCAG